MFGETNSEIRDYLMDYNVTLKKSILMCTKREDFNKIISEAK